jgi:hypothetical protein
LDQQNNNANNKLEEKLAFKADANDPTNFWALALKERVVSRATDFPGCNSSCNSICNLGSSDVDWILHIFVEIGHHITNLKTLLTIKTIKSADKDTNGVGFKFPTANDHFQSFDLPYLRGTLAQTIPVLRLTSYAENVATLRDEAARSTSSVPLGVVDLIGSYLPLF